MIKNSVSEIAVLSTLDQHHRIVLYLGASYRPHPISKEDHLFIITEFMEGVSNSTITASDRNWLTPPIIIITVIP